MKKLLIILSLMISGSAILAAPLHICTSTPDLADLAAAIGGDQVTVQALVKGPEDPHYLQAKPSLIKSLSKADMFVVVGLSLEAGWVPVALRGSRNAQIQPGQPGYLDASQAISPKDVATGAVDRSAGHLHPAGNPHYMLDPVCGLAVADLICTRLGELRPAAAAHFQANLAQVRKRLHVALVGEALANRYEVDKLLLLEEHGQLDTFLQKTGETEQLQGWIKLLRPYRDQCIVADHDMWGYFTDRFHLHVVDHLEPKPGVTPSTKHLRTVVENVDKQQVKVILTAGYFPPRYAAFVAKQTSIPVVPLAHQVGATPAASSYVALVDSNIQAILKALDHR